VGAWGCPSGCESTTAEVFASVSMQNGCCI
jgi:hypothetical protein